jgi:uncharacterized SAM-binding protein YcdF (DUF218 family)
MTQDAPRAAPPFRTVKAVAALAGFVFGLAAAWVAGFLWFAATVPVAVGDEAAVTDAIVVLTGGSDRLATGLALLEAGRGRKLFISGVHKGVDVAELLRLARQSRPDLACCIVLGYSADDTLGNAIETAAWMAGEHYASLRLVTAAYHMRRSLLEFHRLMPEAAIVPHPVFPDAFKKDDWWRWPGTAHLLATEYTKYLAAMARQWFTPRPPKEKW